MDVCTTAYEYKPVRRDHIRLLQFQPDSTPDNIKIEILDDVDYNRYNPLLKSYIALSYTWGPKTGNEALISVNGKRFAITQNLHGILQTILQYHDTNEHESRKSLQESESGSSCDSLPADDSNHDTKKKYWIDQVCINQNDDKSQEKGQQLAQMWRIYSQAEHVFACLGHEQELSTIHEDAIPLLNQQAYVAYQEQRHLAYLRSKSRFMDRVKAKEARTHLPDILARIPYFSRTWIVTEVLQARRLVFFCGRHTWGFEAIMYGPLRFPFIKPEPPAPLVYRQEMVALKEYFASEHTLKHMSQEDLNLQMLAYMFRAYAYTQCAKSQDRIYAMLGHPFMQNMDSEGRLKLDDYHTTGPDELFLVVLEWLDSLGNRLPQEWFVEAFVRGSSEWNIWSLLLAMLRPNLQGKVIERAPGLDGVMVTHYDLPHGLFYHFAQWFYGHTGAVAGQQKWDFSEMPRVVKFPSGKEVKCDGPILGFLLRIDREYPAGQPTGPCWRKEHLLMPIFHRSGVLAMIPAETSSWGATVHGWKLWKAWMFPPKPYRRPGTLFNYEYFL